MTNTFIKTALVSLVLLLLYFGRVLFIPLAFALLLSFIAYPLCSWFEKKGTSKSLGITFSLIILLIPLIAIVFLLISQVNQISNQWPFISEKLSNTLKDLHLPIELKGDDGWVNKLSRNFPALFSTVLSSATAIIVQIVIIPFYVALILYHRSRLVHFLHQVMPDINKADFLELLRETVTTYYNFVKGMLVVYLVVGIMNSIGLFLLGVPNAIVYGFTASILTFVPYIGIIIGSILPAAVAWSMHDNIYYPLGVIAVFTVVQFLEANIIFPLAVSYKIKVNTLVTLIAIFAGAILWGAAGMILFIPFLAILKLVADRHPGLLPIRTLLGTDNDTPELKKG